MINVPDVLKASKAQMTLWKNGLENDQQQKQEVKWLSEIQKDARPCSQ